MSSETLRSLSDEVPALRGRTYLDSAATGLPPRCVTDRMVRMIEEWSSAGEDSAKWMEEVSTFRREASALVGVAPEETAIVQNASAGLAALASSVDFRRRGKVVTCGSNFPSNVLVWQRLKDAGVVKEVLVLQPKGGYVPSDDWERAVDERTAVVAMDYVSWVSGAREDVRRVAEAAHRKGALAFVDAYHAVGVFPVDFARDGLDGGCFGFAKWLCGPHGVSCAFMRKEMLASTSPTYIGWMGAKDNMFTRIEGKRDPFDRPFEVDSGSPTETASRFEMGTYPHILLAGASGAVDFATRYPPGHRFPVIQRRKRELREGLERAGAKVFTVSEDENPGSGILSIVEPEHKRLVDALAAKRIVVSGRFGHVRISPHFYNSEEDVQRFLEGYAAAKRASV